MTTDMSFYATTGVNAGSVKSALDARFDADIVLTEYPTGQTSCYQAYLASGGNGSRVMWVPLAGFSTMPGVTPLATVDGFAPIFLKRRFQFPGKQLFVEFLDASTATTRLTWGALKRDYFR